MLLSLINYLPLVAAEFGWQFWMTALAFVIGDAVRRVDRGYPPKRHRPLIWSLVIGGLFVTWSIISAVRFALSDHPDEQSGPNILSYLPPAPVPPHIDPYWMIAVDAGWVIVALAVCYLARGLLQKWGMLEVKYDF